VRGLRVATWTEAISLGSKILGAAVDWFASRIPRRSLIIVPRDFQPPLIGPAFWSVATFPGSPQKRGMLVRFTFSLRNIARQPVRIVRSRLKIIRRHFGILPGTARVVDGRWLLQPDAETNLYGDYPVRPQAPAVQAEAHWLLEPAVAADGESFRAKVCLIDDFGNQHWTRNLTFRSLPLPRPLSAPDGGPQ
jgi:hypothetical protein